MQLLIRKISITFKTVLSVIKQIWTGKMAKDPGAVIISVHTRAEVLEAYARIEQEEIIKTTDELLKLMGNTFNDIPSVKPKLKN